MQYCRFSETQFSFCFTFEYLKRFYPIIPLPIFPNTVQEGRKGGGYDVGINGNIYFQFKIPTFHNSVSNFYGKYWNTFGHEYYKIKLETDKKQFTLLKSLQDNINEVFYATPEFHLQNDLALNYSKSEIVRKSALFSIKDLPNPKSGYHNLIYSPNRSWGKLFSDPIEIINYNSVNPLELFPEEKNGYTILEQANYIRNKILENQALNETSRYLLDASGPKLVSNIYTILLTEFNIHWYPIISPSNYGITI